MRLMILTVLLAAVTVIARGQKLDLTLPEGLAAKASEKTEINLDPDTVAAGKGMIASALPKDMAAKLAGMKEVHILSYEFDKTGQYSASDIEPIRKQVAKGSGWSPIVNVKEKDETTEIYVYKQGDKVAGILLISAEAKEFSIIHVIGEMSMASLQELVKSTVAYDLGTAKPAVH